MTPNEPRPAPIELLWQPPGIAGMVVAGQALALLLALAPGVAGDRWIYFGLASLVIQWIILLTLAGTYLLRRPLLRCGAIGQAWIALALLMAATWVTGGLAAWLFPYGGRDDGALAGVARMSGMALAVGLLGLAAFQSVWRARQLAVRAKQAELEALQARIRPHFLFNTLNTGAALVHARPQDAEQLLLDLADLFRAALSGPHNLGLGEELQLARRYLEIEQLRFGERLRVHWRLPEQVPDVMIPALSIQPLVENAIRHGIEPSPKGGRVDIEVAPGPGEVRVVISNDLPAAGAPAPAGHRVGLASARERIRALSQGRGHLHTRVQDGRYIATVTLPLP
ncbi:sensor histidine kinase [Arenimonas metalli]|uniref:Signal transduction histidine kinase internal region domain-containing protein n=1 Tax=Arenimonas metalli CF5-1 TaxID=1384056 RepID=A0A091B947_9GAMM|nr:histidine kinase [Arenimonas metalli]KFN48002.1 hypothetical protein N787_07340 [Arenimonas metalli CF5-1]